MIDDFDIFMKRVFGADILDLIDDPIFGGYDEARKQAGADRAAFLEAVKVLAQKSQPLSLVESIARDAGFEVRLCWSTDPLC